MLWCVARHRRRSQCHLLQLEREGSVFSDQVVIMLLLSSFFQLPLAVGMRLALMLRVLGLWWQWRCSRYRLYWELGRGKLMAPTSVTAKPIVHATTSVAGKSVL